MPPADTTEDISCSGSLYREHFSFSFSLPPLLSPLLPSFSCAPQKVVRVLNHIKTVNSKNDENAFDDWLRTLLYRTKYYQGVCGNIAITEDGMSKGIYFSLYKYDSKQNPVVKIKR